MLNLINLTWYMEELSARYITLTHWVNGKIVSNLTRSMGQFKEELNGNYVECHQFVTIFISRLICNLDAYKNILIRESWLSIINKEIWNYSIYSWSHYVTTQIIISPVLGWHIWYDSHLSLETSGFKSGCVWLFGRFSLSLLDDKKIK